MFENTDSTIDQTAATEEPTPVVVDPTPVASGDFGLFNGSSITVKDGLVTVLVPFINGSNATSVPVPLAAAWIVDNLAGALLDEAKKHKP